jgi:hypothetical protein
MAAPGAENRLLRLSELGPGAWRRSDRGGMLIIPQISLLIEPADRRELFTALFGRDVLVIFNQAESRENHHRAAHPANQQDERRGQHSRPNASRDS